MCLKLPFITISVYQNVFVLILLPSIWAFGDEPWYNSADYQPEYCDNRESHVHRRVEHLGKLYTYTELWKSL